MFSVTCYTFPGAWLFLFVGNYMDDVFRIYGDFDLTKSCAGGVDSDDHWFIQGMILTDDEDVVGEKPILKSMDWEYFDKQGFVKYEHDPNGVPSPHNIIGVPHLRKSLDNGEFLNARLLPRPLTDLQKGEIQRDFARETASLIKSIREHNDKYPDNQRTLGWSIEGKYLKKSKSGRYIGRVTNVVISPNPIGTSTYADMAKSHNSEIYKSFMTGTAVSDQTGGAALRRESVAGDVKSTVNSNKNKDKKKMKFKKFDEAKDHYIGEGLEEEEAIKKAQELFPPDADDDDVKKSLKEHTSLLRKAVDAMVKLTKSKTPAEPEEIDDKLQKSTSQVVNEEEAVDITEYMENLEKSINAMSSQSEEVNTELAKSLTSFVNIVEAQNQLLSEIREENAELKKSFENQQKMIKAIGRASSDISFLNLDGEQVVDDDKPSLSRDESLDILMKKSMDGEIDGVDVTRFEMGGINAISSKARKLLQAVN